MTAVPWTCPFCALACDHLGLRADGPALTLDGADCPRARRGLAALAGGAGAAPAEVDGVPASVDEAIAAAAARLAASRQPLLAGLATDVAGARALYPLACALGAICDGDAAAVPLLRALQDRGQFTTSLAEVRARADVIVFVGALPLAETPLIAERCGLLDSTLARHVVVLGPGPGDAATLALWAQSAGGTLATEALPLQGDLFDTLALLCAPDPPAPLAALAERLRGARYAVFVGTASRLPPQGALVVEAVNRLVANLNRSTRAAALWLGAATAQQVFAWLSGLPLRSRCGAQGQSHEPLLFDTQRLVAAHAVDALLWVSSFEPTAPPESDLPLVALGPPALGAACRRRNSVFIAVSTPGIGSAGHVFRTDGTVLMPLHAARDDALPSVATLAQRLLAAVQAS